jgi:hypothetical protein
MATCGLSAERFWHQSKGELQALDFQGHFMGIGIGAIVYAF